MPLLSEQNRRKRNVVIIASFLVLIGSAAVFDLGVFAPELPVASNIVIFALFNLNLIVFLLLLVLLFRNLAKVWFERKHNVIGARFRAKLVLAFLVLAVAPAALIFVIASNFINKSIEGWFKPQVERPLDQALSVAQTYYGNLERTAIRHGQHMGRVIDRDNLLAEERREALAAFLVEQQDLLGISTVTVLNAGGQELVHVKDPILGDLPTRDLSESQLRRGLAGQEVTTVRELASGDLIEAVTPIWSTRGGERHVVGAVVIGSHVTERLEQKVRGISQAFLEYKQLKLLKNPIKGIYILLFLLMTLIVVFSFTWFGLHLARGITGPIEQLAEGTREVAAGNLAYKVQARGDDEIGTLVESFNRMTDDLGQSKRQLEEAYIDLQDKATELEDRRRYTETVLEAVTTGVVSLDSLGRVTTINRAAARMFSIAEEASVGRLLKSCSAGPRGGHRQSRAAGAAASGGQRGGRAAPAPQRGRAVAAGRRHRAARRSRRVHRRGAGVRRSHRALEGPAAGGLARSRPAHRPRDQEPAHAHPALGPAPAAAAGDDATPRSSGWWPSAPRRSSTRSRACAGWSTSSRGSPACLPSCPSRPTCGRWSTASPASIAIRTPGSRSPPVTPRICRCSRSTPTTSSGRSSTSWTMRWGRWGAPARWRWRRCTWPRPAGCASW